MPEYANFPKYTTAKHKGNIGEAVAQYFLSKFALVHKIDGSNDLGNDFICELIKDQSPTNLLFYVQVKFTKSKPSLAVSTQEYWKSSPIPVYVFWIKENIKPLPTDPEKMREKIHYLRMTPKLHDPRNHGNEQYKIYNEIEFKKHLVIDYARTQYSKGFTPIVEPRDYMTINEKNIAHVGRYALYIEDVIPEYKNAILKRAWIQNFVVAELLEKEGGADNLQKAIQSIDLAISMITESDRLELNTFYDRMIVLKDIIASKISNSGNIERIINE